MPVKKVLPLANISLVYMVAVLVTAMRFGLWPSLYTSLISFLAYNFLFTEPFHTFTVAHEVALSTILFFLIVAVLVGNLAARPTAPVEAMRRTARPPGARKCVVKEERVQVWVAWGGRAI